MRDECREWRLLASCELDDELSELGAARLRRHLAECAGCARWVAEAGSATELVRAAELEPVENGICLPVLRRRLSGATRIVAAGASAAAAALAAVLVGIPSTTVPDGSSLPRDTSAVLTPASGCIACADSHIILTTFRQAMVVPRPSGAQNPGVEIE